MYNKEVFLELYDVHVKTRKLCKNKEKMIVSTSALVVGMQTDRIRSDNGRNHIRIRFNFSNTNTD
jgi:hypothetical protein